MRECEEHIVDETIGEENDTMEVEELQPIRYTVSFLTTTFNILGSPGMDIGTIRSNFL